MSPTAGREPLPVIVSDLISVTVGFNPFRQQDKTITDVVMVGVFVAVTLAVVAWAVLG